MFDQLGDIRNDEVVEIGKHECAYLDSVKRRRLLPMFSRSSVPERCIEVFFFSTRCSKNWVTSEMAKML